MQVGVLGLNKLPNYLQGEIINENKYRVEYNGEVIEFTD